MRWPRMHGLPNRTSGSVVIRSRSESWTAGIYTPYSYCIAVLTRSNRLTRRRFPWAHLPMSDEQIDRNLEELGQSFGLRLTDRPPSIQNLGGCPFVPQYRPNVLVLQSAIIHERLQRPDVRRPRRHLDGREPARARARRP